MEVGLYTINDFIVKKAEDLFTDREEPRKAFWDVYESMQPNNVMAMGYYGVGGIGKSTLLKKIAAEIDEKNPKRKGLDYIIYNFEQYTSKEAFLFRLSRELCLRIKGLSFPVFDAAIEKICREGNRDIEKLKEETAKSLIDNPMIDLALSIAGDFVPGVGSAAKAINGIVSLKKKLESHLDENGSDIAIYNLIKSQDNKTLVNEYLHQFFIYDAGKYMLNRETPLVIFLDAYECYMDELNDAELTVGKDNWIHSNYGRLVEIPNVLWVVAGRERINWKEDILPKENLHLMGNLSDIDTVQYFSKSGIIDSELREQLCELCHGTPVYMDICVRTYNEIIKKNRKPVINDFGKDTSELAQRYLGYMDKPTRRLLELISWLPNVWTLKMVENVANKVEYNSYLPELNTILKLSLVEIDGAKYKLHEICRIAAREVCDNKERIQYAIAEYIKEELSNKKCEDDAWSMLSWVFEFLDSSQYLIFEEDDFHLFINKLEIIGTFELHKRCALSKKMYDYFMKTNCSSKLLVHCANVRIKDLLAIGHLSSGYELATSNYNRALNNLPEESNERLEAMMQYARAMSCKDECFEAKKIVEHCYEIRKRVLGEENLDTLQSLFVLASLYRRLGDCETAKLLHEKCYEIKKNVLGEANLSTKASFQMKQLLMATSKNSNSNQKKRKSIYELNKINDKQMDYVDDADDDYYEYK